MNSTATVEVDSVAEKRGEHDGLSFEELSDNYNFLNISSYSRVLCNLILDEIKKTPEPASVLDVGCGRGIGRQVSLQREVRKICGEYWGIEPDDQVVPEEGLFDNYQNALMETAALPDNFFDVIYSSMVMEHVAEPRAFLNAVVQCLKPGGVYIFLTPNARSFVPRVTKICHDLKIDEFCLRLVQKKELLEEYHYPVQFKVNSPKLVSEHALPLGFDEPEYAYIEGDGYRSYFPGPLRLFYKMLVAKRRMFKNPESLVTMICRLTKSK